MKHLLNISAAFQLLFLALLALLTSCSSGGGSDGVSTASISGSIVAAPVAGAQVSVVDVNGNVVVAAVSTNASGRYTLNIPVASLGQDLIIKSSGGGFIDEATGNAGVAGSMSAYMSGSSISNGSTVSVTPDSTIIASLVMNHGKSMTEAKTIFADAFGYTPDVSITPVDIIDPAAVDASNAAKLSGLHAAAFSQLAMDLGLLVNQQFDMFEALACDLSDDVLDGVGASCAVDIANTGVALQAGIQNRFSVAMINFHGNSRNVSGLLNDQIGLLPFAKVALSSSYKVEYISDPMMAAMEGKSMFTLRISDKTSGAAVPDLMVTLMPMMHMASGMEHSSPSVDCVASATAGEYDCVVYYLMASTMANGMPMGYWQLMVMVMDTAAGTTEPVTFYPQVMMAMGDTAKVSMKGVMGIDMIPGMTGVDMSRNYYVFKESLSGTTGAHDFTMFVAAKENMMNYPAVSLDTMLNASDVDYELVANPMTVEVSTNPTDTTSWIEAIDNGNGNWSATAIAGLVDGVMGEIYVKLTVRDQITTDGMAPVGDGTNDYGMFSVTPTGM